MIEESTPTRLMGRFGTEEVTMVRLDITGFYLKNRQVIHATSGTASSAFQSMAVSSYKLVGLVIDSFVKFKQVVYQFRFRSHGFP